MTGGLWTALAAMVATVALEDIQESNNDHGLLRGWWYGQDRWRIKYYWFFHTDSRVGTTYVRVLRWCEKPIRGRRRWWAVWTPLPSVIDLWHLAKTVRVLVFSAVLLAWASISLWWLPAAWFVYGGLLHDRLFYGRLFNPAWWASRREQTTE